MDTERDRTRESLVRVAIAENPLTAAMIEEQLRAAGIRCLVKNKDAVSVMWGTPGLPFSVEVFVLAGDADHAAALLGGEARPELPPPAVPAGATRPGFFRRLWRKLG